MNYATTPIIALSIALIVLSVIITALVLLQSGKNKGLSGSIAGGAETFFGKNKGSSLDRILSKVTIACSILTVACVVALVILISNV